MASDFSKAEFVKSVFRADQAPQPSRPSVVFAGRSNVGKSSLINSLLRRKNLAKTSSTPGRTQEIVYFNVDDRYYFVDIPGYGYAKAPKSVQAQWRPMIEGFLTKTEGVKVIVIILDARREPSAEDLQMIEWLQAIDQPFLFVVSKIDKVRKTHRHRHLRAITEKVGMASKDNIIPYSSEDGTGRNELVRALLTHLNS